MWTPLTGKRARQLLLIPLGDDGAGVGINDVMRPTAWMRGKNGLLAEGWDYWEKQEAADAVRGKRRRTAPRAKALPKPKKRG